MTRFKFTQKANRERAAKVYSILCKTYPDAACSLDHRTPLQLMVSTILSAQCTDVRVNIVSKPLFSKYKSAQDFAEGPIEELEKMIHTCGFYRMKAKNISNACKKLIALHQGEVPNTLEELLELDGVGRKTANVILGTCFNVPGVVVDTHCGRIARRLGFSKNSDPTKIEHDLMKIWPQRNWSHFSHLFVFHGRALCPSRAPQCSQCPLRKHCPFPNTREGQKIAR